MNRQEWNDMYAKRLAQVSGCLPHFAFEAAQAVDDGDWEDEDPEDCAETEYSYWMDASR